SITASRTIRTGRGARAARRRAADASTPKPPLPVHCGASTACLSPQVSAQYCAVTVFRSKRFLRSPQFYWLFARSICCTPFAVTPAGDVSHGFSTREVAYAETDILSKHAFRRRAVFIARAQLPVRSPRSNGR